MLKLNIVELNGSSGSGYGPPVSPGNARSPGSLGGAAWSAPIADWAKAVETTIRVASSAAIDRLANLFAHWLVRIRIVGSLTAMFNLRTGHTGSAQSPPVLLGL